MFPMPPGFAPGPGMLPPNGGQLDLPFTIRGVTLSLRVTRDRGRICFTLFIPTQVLGLIEIAIWIEEAPIRRALERAATSEIARSAASFFQQGNGGAIAELSRGLEELMSPADVLSIAQEAAVPGLWQQAEAALAQYGFPAEWGIPGWGPGASIGAASMPGYARAGDYERTFSGDRGLVALGPSSHNSQLPPGADCWWF